VDIEVVGVAAGGPTVSEQDATTAQTATAIRANLCVDTVRPVQPAINKTPVKFV
jgi:hypothetical protein